MVLKFVSFIENLSGFQQAIPYRSKAQKQNCLNKNFQEEGPEFPGKWFIAPPQGDASFLLGAECTLVKIGA